MSVCSSISSKSSRYSTSSSDSSFATMSPKNPSLHFQTFKSNSSRHSQRSRPGIQRSDHSSASVMHLDIGNSFHSFCSVSSPSSNKHPSTLTQKESVRQKSNSECCVNRCNSRNHPVAKLSTDYDCNRLLIKKSVRFSTENKYIAIPYKMGLSPDEIENIWYTSNEYEVQRISNANILYLMEQEIQRQWEIDGVVTASTLASVVQKMEGSRGLEHLTKAGVAMREQNRKQSMNAVLDEQKRQNKNDDFDYVLQQKSLEQRISNAYSVEVMSATQNAIKRAMHDNAEADVVVQREDYPCANQMISTASRRNVSSSTGEVVRLRLHGNTSCIVLDESIHSLSSSRKLRYCKDRDLFTCPKRLWQSPMRADCPKPIQRQPSMRVPHQPSISGKKVLVSNHSPRKVTDDQFLC